MMRIAGRLQALCILAVSATGTIPTVASSQGTLLHEVFTDHAVLQRDRPIEVFGQARPREAVIVNFGKRRAHARANAAGHWSISLPALPAGGPYTLSAITSSGQTEQHADILVGDVYLCSGQSNMELPVSASSDAAHEISNAADDHIRLLTVSHATAPAPLEHFTDEVHWSVASPDTVRTFSAACFYFARDLARSAHVPLGLIQSTWSGSRIEPWISAQGLGTLPGFTERLGLLSTFAQDEHQGQRAMADLWERWWHASSPSSPWRETDTENWRDVPLPMRDWKTWDVPELAQHDGMVWFRRRFVLSPAQAAGPASLSIGAIDEVDQTWLNGAAVANTFGYATERTYPIPAGMLTAGDNWLVINVLSTWDAGGMYGPPEHMVLKPLQQPPVTLAGGWQYHLVPETMGYPPRAPWESVSGLSSIYNAMIAPLGGLHLRGVLWYQGESNTSEAASYGRLLATLFADWRRSFRDAQLSFLIVQLPNFGSPAFAPGESAWASLREAQRVAVQADRHAALAVTIDVGEAQDLHPPNKQAVGTRLARAARHLLYDDPASASGPVVLKATRKGGEVLVDFADVDTTLRTIGGAAPIGFELCGAQAGTCRSVDAHVVGPSVSLEVGNGASDRVRFCWADAPLCNLYASGLPASPFESEVWDP